MSFDLFECFEVSFKMNLLRVKPHILGMELGKTWCKIKKNLKKFWDKT